MQTITTTAGNTVTGKITYQGQLQSCESEIYQGYLKENMSSGHDSIIIVAVFQQQL